MKMKYGTLLLCWLPLFGLGQALRYQEVRPKMGSPFGITVYHTDTVQARLLVDEAFRLVDSLNALYSDYDSTAWAWRIAAAPAGVWMQVPRPMMDLLLQCRRATRLSSGAFDVTMGALTRFWRQQRRLQQFPAPAEVADARSHTGWHLLELDTLHGRLQKKDAALGLDFGGIAKGLAAREAMLLLQRQGMQAVLVDAGGDLVCGAPPPGKDGWRIAVNRPEEEDNWERPLVLQQQAVATSGNLYQGWEHQGLRYSHIIDPATGYGSLLGRNVTVLASDGATADWLATAFSLLPMRKVRKLARKMQAEYFIAERKGEKIISYRSAGFPGLQ